MTASSKDRFEICLNGRYWHLRESPHGYAPIFASRFNVRRLNVEFKLDMHEAEVFVPHPNGLHKGCISHSVNRYQPEITRILPYADADTIVDGCSCATARSRRCSSW